MFLKVWFAHEGKGDFWFLELYSVVQQIYLNILGLYQVPAQIQYKNQEFVIKYDLLEPITKASTFDLNVPAVVRYI